SEGHMETALAMMLPGLVGGLVLALVLGRLNRVPSSNPERRAALEPISPDMINMAHIRVAGVGGLGMIAASLIVAVNLPEIGFALLVAMVLGAIVGGGLIVYRSRWNPPGTSGPDDMPPALFALRDGLPRTDSRPNRELPGSRAAAIA